MDRQFHSRPGNGPPPHRGRDRGRRPFDHGSPRGRTHPHPPRGRGRDRPPPHRPNPKPDKPPKPTVEPHPTFRGIYVSHFKGDSILTENLVPGKKIYGEKLISVDSHEYRVWNPYRSKIGAAIISRLKSFKIGPGSTVLYLGAASGTTVSHVSDIVAESGRVYAVEFSAPVARELVGVAKMRSNLVPIIEDARKPLKYRMLVPMVDCMFADVAQPDQARIFAINAEYFLKNGGYFMISVKAGCIDSTLPAQVAFASVRKELVEARFNVEEEVNLEAFHGGHAVLVGTYRAE